jgi:hypothetical protein
MTSEKLGPVFPLDTAMKLWHRIFATVSVTLWAGAIGTDTAHAATHNRD